LNGVDAGWVANIAESFRRAGGDGAISSLPDAALTASLKAAGLYGTRESVTFDDPVAYGLPPTTGYADDPVNTASGNFVEVENDLPMSSLLDGLRFVRTYNSRSDGVGPFGAGWASWASARLRVRPEGADYEGPDGQRALFPRLGSGYGRVTGVDGVVEALPTGLVLRWFGGATWEFDDAGLLSRTEHGPGSEVRFHHHEGRLAEMVHVGGKRLTLAWSNERVVSLTCSDGRRVGYDYDEVANLVGVEGQGGGRRYDLDEVGRITRVIDADGVVEVDNTYDGEGRVASQASPFGRRAVFHYLPGRVTVNEDEAGGPSNTYIHDHAGRLIGLIDGHGARLSKSYDDLGNPVAVTERNGAITLRQFDDRARLVREVQPSGTWFSYAYDDADRVVEVAASDGSRTTYRYQGDERIPVEITDPEGGVTTMAVSAGLMRRIVDPDGVEVSFEFDADANIVAAVDGDGNRASIERDAAGRVLAAVTPSGRRTELAYDSGGRLVQRQDPGGAIWRFEYSPGGRLVGVVDPTGARRETRYGHHGEAIELVDELGQVTSWRYDGFSNLVGISAPDGAKWELTYDALARLTAVHDPAGAAWLREYDVAGHLTGTIDPVGVHYRARLDAAGQVTEVDDGLTSVGFDYDELGRAVAQRRPDGTEMRTTYDRCGRRTSITDPLGGVNRYEYSPAGRVVRIVAPSGRTTGFEYDRCGRVAARIDAGGRRFSYRYDADGSLVEVLRPGGESDRFSYDAAGRLVERSVAGQESTSYSYDPTGRVVAVTTPGAGTRRFSYDPAGQMVEAIDANGGVTRYAYNERGWVSEITDPLGGRVRRDYDEVGRVVAEIDQLGRRTSFGYDPAGRVVERVDGAGLRTRWSYDVSGRVRAFGVGEDPEVGIERDTLARPVVIDEAGMRHELRWDWAGRLTERRRGELGLRWRYDADGYRQALGYPDGSETTYSYDDAGDLVSLHHPALGTVSLERDPTGRLRALTAGGLSARWTYHDGQLVGYELEAGGQRRVTELERDQAGRVVTSSIDGATSTISYDAAGQLVGVETPEANTTFSYDENGRLVQERSATGDSNEDTSYSYDAAGQLSERRVGTSVTRFGYDGGGRRVSETGSDHAKTYAWDQMGRLAGMETGGPVGQLSTQKVVDALGELAEVDGTALMWDSAETLSPLCSLGPDPVISYGSPWAIVGGDSVQWLQPDWMGTLGAADVWGAASNPEPGPHMAYRGELGVDGLVWLRNRAYDPGTRAFLSPDPLPPLPATPWAANPYAYAGNDPIGRLDPLGLRPVTEAELAKYREQIGRNVFERGADWTENRIDEWQVGAGIIASGTRDWAGDRVNDWQAGVGIIGDFVDDVASIDLGTFDFGTAAAAGVNVLYGGYKIATGVPLILAGSAATVSLPLIGQVGGPTAVAYGIYQVTTGVARLGRGVGQA
ncbi:MAG: DUF6531 domain-containing protein, partial [Actinomycetota bacterium]|nr:DUF6531 domain-containing protein [Actinomycetota bacterium]